MTTTGKCCCGANPYKHEWKCARWPFCSPKNTKKECCGSCAFGGDFGISSCQDCPCHKTTIAPKDEGESVREVTGIQESLTPIIPPSNESEWEGTTIAVLEKILKGKDPLITLRSHTRNLLTTQRTNDRKAVIEMVKGINWRNAGLGNTPYDSQIIEYYEAALTSLIEKLEI